MEIIKHILERKECYLPLVKLFPDGKYENIGHGRNTPEFITIHEVSLGTEKTPAEKDAQHYIDLLDHPKGDPRCAYHFLCTGEEIYQFLPTWARTAHTGSTMGNSSIGIERLVNVNVDFDKAILDQAKLTASLMHMYNIPITNVVPHKYWSGKECPARLLAGMYGWNWEKFLITVKDFYENKDFFSDIL